MNCRKGAKINIFAAEGPKISSIRYIVALGNALLYALLYEKGDCRFYALRLWLLYIVITYLGCKPRFLARGGGGIKRGFLITRGEYQVSRNFLIL